MSLTKHIALTHVCSDAHTINSCIEPSWTLPPVGIAKTRTRRVAVYLETHCIIGSKRAFTTGVLDR